MENQFFIDAESLSESALAKKHQLENDPSSRKDHMEYLPGMEVIESDVRDKVMSQVNAFDYSGYTAKDVKTALEHDRSRISRLFYRRQQSRFWSRWHSVRAGRQANILAIQSIFLRRFILPITAKTTVYTADLTATMIFTA